MFTITAACRFFHAACLTFSALVYYVGTSMIRTGGAVLERNNDRLVRLAGEQLVVCPDRERLPGPSKLPLAWLTFACASAVRKSSIGSHSRASDLCTATDTAFLSSAA